MSALLIVWLLTDLVATYGVWHFWRHLVPLEPAADTPQAVVLVAIKDASVTTAPFLDSLWRQQYPDYRVVFALESAADPALRLIEPLQHKDTGGPALDIVIAGCATRRAQKVHNLLAALQRLRDEDRIVVFADADTLLHPDWLTDLIRPVATGEAAASTGYRWPLPVDSRLPTLIGAAADLSITTSARSRHWNVCWGGSTAVKREALDLIDLPLAWDRASSDDVTLTQALRARKLLINSPLRVLVPSPVAHTWSSLFSFARRQHLMVRIYAPGHWLFGGFTLFVPAIGAGLAIAQLAYGSRFAACVLLASIAMLQMRSRLRRQIAMRILPPDALAAAHATIRFASWAWPLVHLAHCIVFLSSCVGRRFTWAGIGYRLDGRDVLVTARPAPGPGALDDGPRNGR
ncbi:MAG: glycosyltransferase [Steroidobacterales bacterium]